MNSTAFTVATTAREREQFTQVLMDWVHKHGALAPREQWLDLLGVINHWQPRLPASHRYSHED